MDVQSAKDVGYGYQYLLLRLGQSCAKKDFTGVGLNHKDILPEMHINYWLIHQCLLKVFEGGGTGRGPLKNLSPTGERPDWLRNVGDPGNESPVEDCWRFCGRPKRGYC